MSFLEPDEVFLSRCRNLSLLSVVVGWTLMLFFLSEEGWHYAFLALIILPPIAAYLGVQGNREIHMGKAFAGFLIAFASIPLSLGLAVLERG